ncbi:hypothetical protein H5T54_06955 [Candidatus Bipolaricaulota bacterium]|nr:hypothetical protein [Candidatus Bipolaricaulota bacterium]
MRATAVVLVAVAGLTGIGQGFVGGDILFDLAAAARSAGMGGAGIALPSDDALFVNPAGLPWVEGVQLLSSYGDQFGAARLGVLTVAVPGLAAAGIVLDAGEIGPSLSFRTAGALLGIGVRLGPLGVGARTRVLVPISPVTSVGGALDLAFLWRGPIHLGAMWKGVSSRAPVAGESWPSQLAVGLALPLDLGPVTLALACDLLDLLGDATFAAGGELGMEWLFVRAGYGPNGLAFGGTVRWGPFGVEWAVLVHPVLPPAVRVSFAVRI